MKQLPIFPVLIVILLLTSCVMEKEQNETTENGETAIQENENNEQDFVATLEKHLNAVTNRDIETLESTMSPEGKMQLIMPGMKIINSAQNFIKYHDEWFQDPDWTFETEILNYEVGDPFGLATTQIIYREPEREGKPYFNRMIVTYGLEKIDGKWYIISDHASSVEKSTDS